MSVPEFRTKTTFPVPQEFPKTTAFFDWLRYVGHRLDDLIWESKRLIFSTAFLLFLVYELAHFAKFLLKNWNG